MSRPFPVSPDLHLPFVILCEERLKLNVLFLYKRKRSFKSGSCISFLILEKLNKIIL